MHFDLLVVGTGLYGSTIANKALQAGKSVLMLEKRDHIGGNVYTEDRNDIHVHRYGAHIFIPTTNKFGAIYKTLLNSTGTHIPRSPTSTEYFIPYHSTCTPSTNKYRHQP